MGKAKAKGKQRLDKFYHLAKEQGYRSRAAFKLIQLDAKFRFLPSSRSILDLCAAPGGWLQVAVRHAPAGAFVVGVDLFPILPIRGAHSIVEDITTTRCRFSIKRLMDSNGCVAFDAVLHDGSPNIGGAWAQEATNQSALVVDSIRLATEFLAPKGTFVTKVFRSQDYSAILYCLKQLFDKVEVTKPVASRSASAEIYVIGLRYKAPAKIDPRLLDVKHLFQGAIAPPKVVDVLGGSKQKRNREGYEDGNTTLRKVGLASDFVWSDAPLEFLGSVNLLSFDDPACNSVRDHELTTEEIKLLCEDLRVLDKHSFKHLLRWRMRVRKALSPTQKSDAKVINKEEDIKGNEDDRLLNEMEELTDALKRKKKREKKLLAKRREKDKARKATGMQIDATADSFHDRELFSLSFIKGKNELVAFDSMELNDDDKFKDSDDEGIPAAVAEHSSSEFDSDEEQKRYDDELDKLLNQAYEKYVARKGGSTKQRKRAKMNFSDGKVELFEDDDVLQPEHDSDEDQHPKEVNPLMVPLQDDQPTQDEITEKWFSQDVFAEAMEEETLGMSDSQNEVDDRLQKEYTEVPKMPEVVSEKPKETSTYPQNSQNNDFEIVPAQPMETSDDSSSDESEEEDDYTKAEILAYAKKMLRKKRREQILDDAYNRYMFDDEGLPTWFVEEEKNHRQTIKPVTKEEVAAMKVQFKEIDARPAKKVAEAKARKKHAAMKKLDKARQKANSITEQTDISNRSKNKMIDQLYKKAAPTKPKKEFVVAKKGVTVKGGKGKVVVDRRMKKDVRSQQRGESGKKGGLKKGKGAKMKGKGQAGKKAPGRKGKDKRNKGKTYGRA